MRQKRNFDPSRQLGRTHFLCLLVLSGQRFDMDPTSRLCLPPLLHRFPNFLQRVLVRRLHSQLDLQRRSPFSLQNFASDFRVFRNWGPCVDSCGELAPD